MRFFLLPARNQSGEAGVLPVSRSDGKLLDIGLYGRDVICFAEEFLKLSGLAKDEARLKDMDALQISGASAETMSLESRNRQLVNTCFFNQAFHANVKSLQESCGVLYMTLTEAVLRNEELEVDTMIHPELQQLFDGCGTPSAFSQFTWATDTGFFYVLQVGVEDMFVKNILRGKQKTWKTTGLAPKDLLGI